MENHFDSRVLGQADCYGQRFMRVGVYPYNVVAGHGQAVSTDRPFVIKVEDRGKTASMTQHNVTVLPQQRGFTVDKPEIAIAAGDMVVWHSSGAAPIPYAVIGDQTFFNSYRMVNECGFSHAFGKPGQYRWTDAHGSGLSGTVIVRDPGCKTEADIKRWRLMLSQGTLVMIAEGKVDKPLVEILTGQSVFFAIVTSPGISITDTRLLELPAYGWIQDRVAVRAQ